MNTHACQQCVPKGLKNMDTAANDLAIDQTVDFLGLEVTQKK